MSNGWRTIALCLGALCGWQAWRNCNRPMPPPAAECAKGTHERSTKYVSSDLDRSGREDEEPPPPAASQPGDGPSFYGVKVPPWAMAMLPAPGEDLRAYRDRMIPLAQIALAPHRARVASSFENFAANAHLDERQQADLDATTKETAQAIQDRLFNAALSGELAPKNFKPMTAVGVARDVLDIVDKANRKFVGGLREDQRTQLSQHPFDFGDYLLFSTRWEDAISGL
jgi:hypothetical protein